MGLSDTLFSYPFRYYYSDFPFYRFGTFSLSLSVYFLIFEHLLAEEGGSKRLDDASPFSIGLCLQINIEKEIYDTAISAHSDS